MELFLLWVSFIGWGLLCVLTFGLLFFYVQPYYKITYAAYYNKFKEMAVAGGKVSETDFERKVPSNLKMAAVEAAASETIAE